MKLLNSIYDDADQGFNGRKAPLPNTIVLIICKWEEILDNK